MLSQALSYRIIGITIAEIMTDKPPAYENQFPAGYGMQSEQPAGWTAPAPPQPQQQGNHQQQPPTTNQFVRKYDINS